MRASRGRLRWEAAAAWTFLMAFLFWIVRDAVRPISDPDFWWHLASGRYIVQEWTVPRVDVFSHTALATTWWDSYWLYEFFLYHLYRLTSLPIIQYAHAALAAGVYFILWRRLHRGETPWILSVAALLLVHAGSLPQAGAWGVKSSLISLLGVSLLLATMDQLEETGWKPWLWVWPMGFMVWAQLHRGFAVGLLLAALLIVPQRRRTAGRYLRRLLWLGLCAGATLLTPYFTDLYLMMWRDFSMSPAGVTGWARPHWSGMPVFWITLAALWVWIPARWAMRRDLPLRWILIAGVFSALAAAHIVFVPYFMIIVVPLAVQRIGPWLRTRMPAASWRRFDALAVPAAAVLFLILGAARRVESGVDRSVFPLPAMDLIHSEKLRGPFYNDYRFGGFWMWQLGPEFPVFIDGRYPAVDGYRPLMDAVLKAKDDGPTAWAAFLDGHAIQTALVHYWPGSPYPSVFDAYFPRDRWALVYWDDAGLLFLRRTEANASVIRRLEFRRIRPDGKFNVFGEEVLNAGAADRAAIERELIRNRALHPDSRLTQKLIGIFEEASAAAPAGR